jgi:hypothetical protein
VEQSLARVRELYLEGDMDRAEYERRRSLYRERLSDLTDVSFAAIIATGYIVQHFSMIWDGPDQLNKKRLLQALLTAATVRGNALIGWQPNSAFYPLLRHVLPHGMGSLCHSGSDGGCSRV